MTEAIRVSDLMSKPVVVISPETCAAQVLAIAEKEHIHHFPILQAGHLVGFVCTCDLEQVAAHEPVMPTAWHHPATVSPACLARDAARILLLNGVGSLVVVDPTGIRGILTTDDLRRASPELARLLEPARCVLCRAGAHLRPGPDGKPICVRCKHDAPS